MHVVAFGINHKTAPIEIREQFFLSDKEQDLYLSELKHRTDVLGAFVVSTCNRIEVYGELAHADVSDEELIKTLFMVKDKTWGDEWRRYFYVHRQDNAIEHLLQVTCSLDSLVLGEKQVLGQVADAFERSHKRHMLTSRLNVLKQATLRAGKLAHSQTDIGYGGTSVSWAAVNFAEQKLQGFKDASVLIIGSGQMGSLAAQHVSGRGAKNFYIMNRTKETAIEVALRYGAEAVSFFRLQDILKETDVCICAVDAPHYILDVDILKETTTQRQKPLLLIDISMPRNIDPDVRHLDHVQLYAIDDLGQTLEASLEKRKLAMPDVYRIIDRKITEFYHKITKMNQWADEPLVAWSGCEASTKREGCL